jgi:2-polyprenyl-3-methyl-5-hydroxy-6-metoxy-1,4-benzoquinol methylase
VKRPTNPPGEEPTDEAYAHRLQALERRWLARAFDVQRLYRRNIQRLGLGFVLDVGCGLGRNLRHAGGTGVGIDVDEVAVATARARGLVAFTPTDFAVSEYAQPRRFDSLLMAHVLEHLPADDGEALLRTYLPYIRANGRVVLICPQHAGFRADPTHMTFLEARHLERIAERCAVSATSVRSHPFPRVVGRLFPHNETVLVGNKSG